MLHPFSSPFIILETNTRYYYEQVTFDYSIRRLIDGRIVLVTASFIYSGNQFAGIQYPDGQATHFSYEEGELSGIFYTPPKDMADGHAWVHFNKIGDKTYEVSRGGEPSMDIDYREEVTLDTNGLPVRVTFTGIFQQGANQEKQIEEGDRKSDIEKLPIITKETDILNNRTCPFECTFACFIR